MNIFDLIKKRLQKVGTYRVITDLYVCPRSRQKILNAYLVQVLGFTHWHTVKVFKSDDEEYARNCAYELLEMLEEDIEPKPISTDNGN